MPYLTSFASCAKTHFAPSLDKAKLAVGAVLYPVATYKWFQFVKAHPVLSGVCASSPFVFRKIYRPYLCTSLACSERVDLLIDHYDFLLRSNLAGLIKRAAIRPVNLCHFAGKSGQPYRLSLSVMECGHRNGELVLRLMSNNMCIYTVAFIFAREGDSVYVKIGALYGLLATDKITSIKRITRDLYGCRPKDLMVEMVREIGAYLGCRKTVLISNRNKIQASTQRVCKKSSDYDRLCRELHAVERADGDFELPCAAREVMSAATKKSSEAFAASIRLAMRNRLEQEGSSSRYRFPVLAGAPRVNRAMEKAAMSAVLVCADNAISA